MRPFADRQHELTEGTVDGAGKDNACQASDRYESPGRLDFAFPTEQDIRRAHIAGRSPKQLEIDRFRNLGVEPLALGMPWPVLVDQVVFRTGELFDFARDLEGEHGERAYTIVVSGYDGLIDIAAWQPCTNRTALWLNAGFAIGEEQIFDPHFEPLPVWRTPLNWLRHGRKGIVIVRPAVAHIMLADVPNLLAEDVEHGGELETILTPPRPACRVLVVRRPQGRAA